ncbi:hypothetical protein [Pelosinus sp. IPA-1]|uniref:hypothetical protein n=1 Tax=Pelosinus sp. IPA-1 TaxID=3029569 RepID=UPI0024361E97|nr:hypothetical protein [Pelosinus sp. IPA-1]GMB01053.1 hypothetical protein PIPA1_38520 [Pelosinus sp. IPA-1]
MYIHIGWLIPVIIIAGIIGVFIIGLCVAAKRGDKRLEKENLVVLCEECHKKAHLHHALPKVYGGGSSYIGIDRATGADRTKYYYILARQNGRAMIQAQLQRLFGQIKKKRRPRWRQIIKAENIARKRGA